MTDLEFNDIKKRVDELNKKADEIVERNKRLLLFL